MWVAPVSGTDQRNVNPASGGTDEIDILWNGGPVVGKAVYQPQQVASGILR